MGRVCGVGVGLCYGERSRNPLRWRQALWRSGEAGVSSGGTEEWGVGFGSDVPSRCPPRGRDSFSRMRGGAGEPSVIDGGPPPLYPPRDWESLCRVRDGIFVSSKKVGAEQESGGLR